jgi:hemolysin III
MSEGASNLWGLREPFCALSHAVGLLLSIGGLVALLLLVRGRFWHTIAFTIYGLGLIGLYAASTLYHSLPVSPLVVSWPQRLDFTAIYTMIAGSYTPVCLITLRGKWGRILFGLVWTLAACGIACSLIWYDVPAWTRLVLYVAMGWLVLVALSPLRAALPPEAMGWLVAGGIIYSIGTVIFALDWPYLWPGYFTAHDLWHLFVLAGSACHFVFMARFVARS